MFKDDEIRENRRMEAGRARKQPLNEVTVEMENRIRIFQERISENPSITADDFSALLIETLGLDPGSEKYLQYMERFLNFRS